MSDIPPVGAYSPPLRLTARLLEVWASRVSGGDDLFGTPVEPDVEHEPQHTAAKPEEEPLRRVGAPRGTR
jgi:hypothetical protein